MMWVVCQNYKQVKKSIVSTLIIQNNIINQQTKNIRFAVTISRKPTQSVDTISLRVFRFFIAYSFQKYDLHF